MSGGLNVFELIYEKRIPYLDYNLRRILEECILYDSDIEADHYDQLSSNAGKKQDKYSIKSKLGLREIKFQMWLEENHPDYIAVEFTFLTTKEFERIAKSANYYRNLARKG